jgi:hypothetical protein
VIVSRGGRDKGHPCGRLRQSQEGRGDLLEGGGYLDEEEGGVVAFQVGELSFPALVLGGVVPGCLSRI